jgi:hypothetical protein
LLRLLGRIREEVIANISSIADGIVEEADLDSEDEDEFDELRSKLRMYQELFEDDESGNDLLQEAEDGIDEAEKQLKEMRKEHQKKKRNEEWEWENYLPAKVPPNPNIPSNRGTTGTRSIFSDVDK